MEVLDQVRQTPPVPPRRVEPEIPASLETICLKCLEKEPAKRYGSASALAADLRRFLDDKPILARPPGPAGRLMLWARRNKTGLVVAALLVLAVALTWFSAGRWQSYRLEEAERERAARERQWKDYQETRSKELFEKLLADGPSTWPMPAEERLVLQNALHDLQVRKNSARLQGNDAEVLDVDAQLKRAEPILRRLQADLVQGEMMGLQLPGVAAARTSAYKTRSANNLKQLSLAMHNYANSRRTLPGHALYGKDEKPLLSWRVALLPYLGQMPLYRKFKLDEPWDSAQNKPLLKFMPPSFIPPGENPGGEPYTTFYQVFVGKGGPVGPVFEPGSRYRGDLSTGIPDGSSGTFLIVEAGSAIPWTKPDDLVYDPDGPLPKLGGIFGDGFNAAFADGSVRFIAREADEAMIRALITRNGGEPVEWTKLK
jgi:prepilin-type processing-associated H-X9-DG protein